MADGKVFLSIGPSLQAVDEFNGSLIWRFDSVQDTSDVAVAYGKVFVSTDNYLYCLDEVTGKQIWKYNEAEYSWLSSIPSVADGKVLVPAYDKLLCVDTNSGTLLWTYSTISSRALPAIAEDMILFAVHEGIVAIGDQVPRSTDNFVIIIVLVSVTIIAAVSFTLLLKHQNKPN